MRFRKSRETTCACVATDGPQIIYVEPASTSWKDTIGASRQNFTAKARPCGASSGSTNNMNVIERAVDKSPDGFDEDGGKIWHVWAEGYAATGEHGTATFVGHKWAKTFNRACELLHKEKGGVRTQGEFTPGTDDTAPRFWGCRLFDNERAARESYG